MTMRSLFDDLLITEDLNVQTITTAALNSGDVDMFGFDGLEIVVVPGDIDGLGSGSPTGGTITVLVEHADDDGTGAADTYANVAAVDIVGAVAAAGIVDTLGESNSDLFHCSYVGDKRFVRTTLTPSGLGSGGPITILSAKHHGRHRSVQATQTP